MKITSRHDIEKASKLDLLDAIDTLLGDWCPQTGDTWQKESCYLASNIVEELIRREKHCPLCGQFTGEND
jgi:hypothetical protein